MTTRTSNSAKDSVNKRYTETQEFLLSLGMKGRRVTYGIDRMMRLVELLGHPEHRLCIIHVAGSNGKGSTSAMLDAIYREAGYYTGLYTSPHLVTLRERIAVRGRQITKAEIVAYTKEFQELIATAKDLQDDDYPSFFELMTAMALVHFVRSGVEVAILETGLGGRLDATNVVDPALSIITSISLDHTLLLGDTVEKIAREKGGIIKPGKPVIIGVLPEGAEQTLRSIAEQKGASIQSITEAFGQNEENFPETGLTGKYQRRNAAIATLAVHTLKQFLPKGPNGLERGLQQVYWPGRWEKKELESGQTLILDASHNAECFIGLAENLKALIQETGTEPILLVGSLGNNRGKALMETISEYAQSIFLLRANQKRASDPKDLEEMIPDSFKGTIAHSTVSELFPRPHTCCLGKNGDTIVVTGSIYLIGEVIEALNGAHEEAEHHLQDGAHTLSAIPSAKP